MAKPFGLGLRLFGMILMSSCEIVQRLGLRDAAVVEGWAQITPPDPAAVAAAAAAERKALRELAPKRTTPTLHEVENGRDTGELEPEDLSMANPFGQPYPEAETFKDLIPGTEVSPCISVNCIGQPSGR